MKKKKKKWVSSSETLKNNVKSALKKLHNLLHNRPFLLHNFP